MDEILRNTEPNAEKLASAIANACIECVLIQGREMPSVMAALLPTLTRSARRQADARLSATGLLNRRIQRVFIRKPREDGDRGFGGAGSRHHDHPRRSA